MPLPHIHSIDIRHKKLFIRADLNVPFGQNGQISDDTRIQACLPLLEYAINQQAKILLTSHRGRPQEGQASEKESLAPIAQKLTELLGQEVALIKNWLEQDISLQAGQIVLLENCRFNKGEMACDEALSKKLGSMCDIFVMEAFATAHRKQATTYGIAKYAPQAIAGVLLHQEISSLRKALASPQKPMLAIVAGSKVSSKLTILENLAKKVDQLILGGGIANTFLLAAGKNIGKSLYEPDLIESAKHLLEKMHCQGGTIPLPSDVVVAKELSSNAKGRICSVDEVGDEEMILDIGPNTCEAFHKMIQEAKTIVWNGPVGVFELSEFETGTKKLAESIASSHAFSIAGGGDTIAAINKFHIASKLSYISTAGGAFLEFLEGKPLPAIEILEARAKK